MSPTAPNTSARGLLATLAALFALAGLSLALRYANLGTCGLAVALVIAAMKAALVAVFFMEILTEKATVRWAMAAGLTLFALMLALVVADVLTRAAAPLGDPPGTAPRAHG